MSVNNQRPIKTTYSSGAWLFFIIIFVSLIGCLGILYLEVFDRGIDNYLDMLDRKPPEYQPVQIHIFNPPKQVKGWFDW